MDRLTVTLAGKTYDVEQLTLGQIEDLSIAVALPDDPNPQEAIRRSFERSRSVIAAVTGLSADELRSMRITADELRIATSTILEFSGLIQKDNAAGEAKAGAE